MVIVTPGIVLSRRPSGEYGRLASIYTLALGKVAARFIGVDRPAGKLKALAEPMVHAEYRLYVRPGTGHVTVTGGRIIDSFPGIRGRWDALMHGLAMCEQLMRMAPDAQPNSKKFELMAGYLAALDEECSPWLPVSFGLRLLELAGLGLGHMPVEARDREIWDCLHCGEAGALRSLPRDAERLDRFQSVLEDAVERHIESPLRTRIFRRSI